jgi:hypothetical protein
MVLLFPVKSFLATLLVFALCLFNEAADAQLPGPTPAALMQQGEAAYHAKMYSQSAQLYDAALKLLTDTAIGSQRYMAAYNSACSWALAGQPDSAFMTLSCVSLEQNFGTFYSQMVKDSDFNSIRNDKRWQQLCIVVKHSSDALTERQTKLLAGLNDPGKRINYSLLCDNSYWIRQAAKLSVKSLAKKIAAFNNFPAAPQKDWWTLYHLKVNDTLQVAYLVHIPRQYNAHVKTPLYIFLHGGVGRTTFSNPLDEIHLETPLLQRTFSLQAFVILPFARKDFNWLNHPQAFETILEEIARVKGLYNIDDNKVYIGGHSDGARGAFWFALNKRTPFAAIFGLNYFPVLLTGNTPLRNLRGLAPFEGVSGIEDQGFNIRQITQFADYGKSTGANWKNTPIHGAHTLPYDHPDSVSFLFDHMVNQTRKPIPQKLQWETDDVSNGECYWIKITELDTLQSAQAWQQAYNPAITSVKTGKDEIRNLNKRRAGAVIAEIRGNDVYISTSRVKKLEILVPELWTEVYRSLNIHLNGRPVYRVRIHATKSVLLDEFFKRRDRVLLIADKIKVPN